MSQTKLDKSQINTVSYTQVENLSATNTPFTPAGSIAATNTQAAIEEVDAEKQALLVSGTNIKTINSTSILGSGDLSTFDYSGAWQRPYSYNDFITSSNSEVFSINAISTGTTSRTTDTGRLGVIVLSSSASSNTGYQIETAINNSIESGHFFHAVFRVQQSTSTYTIRAGYAGNNITSAPAAGAYFSIAGTVVTPTNRTGGVSTTGTTYNLTTGVYYIFEIFHNGSDIRYVIRSADGTIVDDQTLSGNVLASSTSCYVILQAFNTGSAANAICVVDYIGFGRQ